MSDHRIHLKAPMLTGNEGRLGPGKEALGKLAQISNENEEERVFSSLPLQINI